AIILSSAVKTSPFTSGTTSFLEGSILHADELSTTVIPASANLGAHSKEIEPPAENKAISGWAAIASCNPIIVNVSPLNVTFLPTDFSDATTSNSVTG